MENENKLDFHFPIHLVHKNINTIFTPLNKSFFTFKIIKKVQKMYDFMIDYLA